MVSHSQVLHNWYLFLMYLADRLFSQVRFLLFFVAFTHHNSVLIYCYFNIQPQTVSYCKLADIKCSDVVVDCILTKRLRSRHLTILKQVDTHKI